MRPSGHLLPSRQQRQKKKKPAAPWPQARNHQRIVWYQYTKIVPRCVKVQA
jgi:hypothetical protein